METISRKDLTIAWLAGMIDADGCISLKVNNSNRRTIVTSWHIPYTQLTTTCTFTAEYLKKLYKELGIPYYFVTKSNGNPETRKPIHIINVQGLQRSKKIIPLIMPYLVTKQREAELIMEFIEIRDRLFKQKEHSPRENAILQELKEIKGNRNIVKNPQRLYARIPI